MPLLDYSYTCPPGSVATSFNTNTGAIMDRVNVRCNDAHQSQFPDIGAPLGYVTSPKNPVIRLPAKAKGWESMDVGYQFWAPKGREVAVSIRLCAKGSCFTAFIYGLSICSPTKGLSYSCGRIETFDKSGTGKVINGFETTYSATKKYGYITRLEPKFVSVS